MWTPHEVRKLIAQAAGVIFGIAGVILIIKGVQASGHLNISSNILSGQIESGSAGLFLIFLSFLLLILPALFGDRATYAVTRSTDAGPSVSEPNTTKRLAIATLFVFILTLSLIIGGDYLESHFGIKSGGLLVMGGIATGMLTAVMFIGLISAWVESKQNTELNNKPKDGAS